MTTTAAWRLNDRRAVLAHGPLTGILDLDRPELGLEEIAVDGHRLDGAGLLAVELPRPNTSDPSPLADAYVRGGDLVATYAGLRDELRIQVYWRSHPTGLLDLQVSAQTALLDASPELATRSLLPPGEAFRAMATNNAQSFALGGSIVPADGPGCIVLRMADRPISFVEMINPSDFQRDSIDPLDGSPARIRLVHRLFPWGLEKGVILRARIRCGFVPRENDIASAWREYETFIADPPPLTT